jgi:hypothetical protein
VVYYVDERIWSKIGWRITAGDSGENVGRMIGGMEKREIGWVSI